jgi:hypothetical protein
MFLSRKCGVQAVCLGCWLLLGSLSVHAQARKYSVLCNVVTTAGAPAQDPKVNFSISVDGHSITDLAIAPSSTTRRILLLADSSGSIGRSNARSIALQAMDDFVQSASSSDQLGLVDFSRAAYFDIPLQSATSFKNAFADPKLRKLRRRASGGTALFDAIIAAIWYLQKEPQEGDSIYLVSDGLDNSSTMSLGQLGKVLGESKVRVYLFLLVPPKNALIATPGNPHPHAQLKGLIDLIAASGGNVIRAVPTEMSYEYSSNYPIYFNDQKQRERTRQEILGLHDLIEKAYRIQFQLDPGITAPAEVKVNLLNESGMTSADEKTLCPRYVQP